MYLHWVILANVIYTSLITPATALAHPKITRMEIESNIRFRLATTTIRMSVNNTEKESKIFYFEVLLPNDALVYDVYLNVNGTSLKGRTEKKSKDYREWKKHTKKNFQKSIKKQTFFDINVFATNTTIAGKSEAFFNFTYKTLLLRKDGLYTHRIPIFLRQHLVVKQLHVFISLWEPQNIHRFTASLIKEKNMPDIANDHNLEELPQTLWKSRNNILVDYTEKLGKLRNVFSRVFQVQYDLKRPEDNYGDILWHKDRGLYFFNHVINTSLPKDLVFTIDMSSSMAIDWEQTIHKAFPIIFQKMKTADRFNILMYNRSVYEWKKELQNVTNENIESAMQFIKSFPATGISNINLALNKSLDHLNDTRPGRFQAVYFLTDGFQSTTDVKTNTIINQVKHINKGRNIPIFTLALGSTSDVILLRAIAAATGGKFKKIYERQLSYAVELMVDFFGEINTHLLKNLTLKNCDKEAHRFDMSRDYYRGSENIFYITPDCFPNNSYQMVVVTGRGYNGINNYTAPLLNSDLGLYNDNQKEEFLKSYLEFLALRTAINMDDRKAIRAYPGLVLTPWSFITFQPPSAINLNQSGSSSGSDVNKIWMQEITGAGVGDPHFMIELKGLKRPVCFNMMGKPGDVINLVYDKRNGIFVNAKIICSDVDCQKTYLGVISVSAPTEKWTISPEDVQVTRRHSWQDESRPLKDQFTAHYTDRRSIVMTWKSSEKKTIKLLIRRSQSKKANGTKYLDFYLMNGSGLSNATDGLIGQFTNRRGVIFKVRRTANGKMKSDIRIHYKNKYRTFSAVLTGNRRSFQLRKECWTVWKEGRGLVRGTYQDYVTQGLFQVPIFKHHLRAQKT